MSNRVQNHHLWFYFCTEIHMKKLVGLEKQAYALEKRFIFDGYPCCCSSTDEEKHLIYTEQHCVRFSNNLPAYI